MQRISTNALRDDEYLRSSGTCLNETVLVEIGRVVANYGLLVFRIRELVLYVASQSDRFPSSIGTQDAVQLFPSVLDTVQPAFMPEERYKLGRVIECVATAKAFLDRSVYCSWGSIAGNEHDIQRVARVEYKQYEDFGPCIDRSEYSKEDLSIMAIEILKAMNYVGEIYAMLVQKVVDEPNRVRKILNRKIRRHERTVMTMGGRTKEANLCVWVT